MLRKLRNRFRNMDEIYRLLVICVIAIITLGTFGTVSTTAVIVKHRSYDGDARDGRRDDDFVRKRYKDAPLPGIL